MVRYVCSPSRGKIALLLLLVACIFSTSLISLDLDSGVLAFIGLSEGTAFNLMHIPLFMFITVLWLQVAYVYDIPRWRKSASAFLFSLLVGVLYEFVQLLIPGRNPSLADIAINSLAALAGIALYLLLERTRPNMLRKIVCRQDSP